MDVQNTNKYKKIQKMREIKKIFKIYCSLPLIFILPYLYPLVVINFYCLVKRVIDCKEVNLELLIATN